MSLRISTFSNVQGGNVLYKALGHPLTSVKMRELLDRLAGFRAIAVYDPRGQAADLAIFYDLSPLRIASVFVQDIAGVGKQRLGREARPVTELPQHACDAVFITAYDSARELAHIRHLLPAGVPVITLDDARIPGDMLSNKRTYLDKSNFATNFAFFREGAGQHTRVVSANYWAGYGAPGAVVWCCLFDADGKVIAQWRDTLGQATHAFSIDSCEIRARFNLGEFTGSLFIHVTGIAGHDIVKYALDTYGDDASVLSCTHDANAWPSDLYAGLPAPATGERVLLWVQNSHPCAIPANGIGLNLMGDERIVPIAEEIPPFATRAIDVAKVLPGAAWPQQIEIQAGSHFVRPRYEVISPKGRVRIAHANVERSDLQADPGIPSIGALMGKGYILPAPVLPPDRFRTQLLPTPMSTAQRDMPVAVIVYDCEGNEVARRRLGRLPRNHATAVDVAGLLQGRTLAGGYGHIELVYDFADGGSADGWLHALVRYDDNRTGHAAETSFGAHIFNTMLVYRNEPQSYAGAPPGLSTRLFLRLGAEADVDTFCHLVYPASTPWHAKSETDLELYDGKGALVTRQHVKIPCSGSLHWRYREMFDADAQRQAGPNAYILIRDTTCRLFGYHGLVREGKAFSLDHMFGF